MTKPPIRRALAAKNAEIAQLRRELNAAMGALKNSGNVVQLLNDDGLKDRTEIARLTTAVKSAEAEGMERAAEVCKHLPSGAHQLWNDRYAAAIRALVAKHGGKP
jgi:uncharacterized protein YjgD (DUF1641 family)